MSILVECFVLDVVVATVEFLAAAVTVEMTEMVQMIEMIEMVEIVESLEMVQTPENFESTMLLLAKLPTAVAFGPVEVFQVFQMFQTVLLLAIPAQPVTS
jgi:hypothetical protein